ncbi:MAG: hypothetical protein JWO98_5316 [Frankiales bacterium]|nr:hypothetical protein [Frankiales bacterium]
MKVWVVMDWIAYEGRELRGVYVSCEAAETAIPSLPIFGEAEVEEREVLS